MKVVFRKAGRYDWRTPAGSASRIRCHPSFFVRKLWSYFVPDAPDRATQAALEALYRDGHDMRPVVAGDPAAPRALHRAAHGEAAGRPRRRPARAGSARDHTTDWAWIGSLAGQQLFYPPNVAGWDDTRWLDTATFRGRWIAASGSLQDRKRSTRARPTKPVDAQKVLTRALAFWHNPPLTAATPAALLALRARRARGCRAGAGSRSSTRCSSRTRCAS